MAEKEREEIFLCEIISSSKSLSLERKTKYRDGLERKSRRSKQLARAPVLRKVTLVTPTGTWRDFERSIPRLPVT